jgi:uncharacterized membrane protein YraQ (UPF0718 family)
MKNTFDTLPSFDFDNERKKFDKSFKKGWRLAIIGAIVCVIMAFVIAYAISTQIDNKKKDLQSYVGKTVVVGKDTLTIVNYSMVFENFTLSNGTKVDEQFVKQQNK